MAAPGSPRRRGLRRARRVLATTAGILFVATGVATVRVLSAGASPLPATAFVYGVLMAPLTLPCTGPLIISAQWLQINRHRLAPIA